MADQINNPSWAPTTLYKRGKKPKAPKRTGTAAVADPDMPKKKKKISRELRETIMKGRSDLKMKQKELARLCNVPVATVQAYEKGTGSPNIAVVRKMERALRVKFSVYK